MSEKQRVLHLTKKDFIKQTFRSGGKGGQNQNKRDTGVRIIHPASGARGESREGRTQLTNQRLAFERMASSETFKGWIGLEHAKRSQQIDKIVDEQMKPENLLIEYGKTTK